MLNEAIVKFFLAFFSHMEGKNLRFPHWIIPLQTYVIGTCDNVNFSEQIMVLLTYFIIKNNLFSVYKSHQMDGVIIYCTYHWSLIPFPKSNMFRVNFHLFCVQFFPLRRAETMRANWDGHYPSSPHTMPSRNHLLEGESLGPKVLA